MNEEEEKKFKEFYVKTRGKKSTNHKYDVYQTLDIIMMMRKTNKMFNVISPVNQRKMLIEIFDMISQKMMDGYILKAPYGFGDFFIKVYTPRNHKSKNWSGVNWGETLKLWYKDEEAKKNKVLIKHEICKEYHKLVWKWGNINYLRFYYFAQNRGTALKILDRVKKHKPLVAYYE